MKYDIQFNCMQTKIKYKGMAARSVKLASFPFLLLKVFGFEVLKVGAKRIAKPMTENKQHKQTKN
jgi:hypothetical protein